MDFNVIILYVANFTKYLNHENEVKDAWHIADWQVQLRMNFDIK